MMQRTATVMMKSRLAKAGTAILFAAIGVACLGDDNNGVPGKDAGTSTDGGNNADGGSKRDGASTGDGGNNGDTGSTADTGKNADTGSTADTGSAADTGSTADTGSAQDAGNDGDTGTGGSTPPVNLGAAGNYVILAKTGISTVPPSAVTGDIGVSPNKAISITQFSLIADSTNVFATSTQVTGKVYASDYAVPTPANLTAAISDMQLAFTDAAGRAPGVTELGAGDIGGRTLAPGVYKWGTGLLIPSDVTLTGTATDVWIFQIAQNLTVRSAVNIVLTGGAVPKNVFWQVAGSVDVGTTAHVEGIILTQTLVAMKTGASINGRLLAQTAVTLDNSTVVQP